MPQSPRDQLEQAQAEATTLSARLVELELEVVEAVRVAGATEDRQASLERELTQTAAEHRALEKATRKLQDNLPTHESQAGAERAAALFLGGAVALMALLGLWLRFH